MESKRYKKQGGGGASRTHSQTERRPPPAARYNKSMPVRLIALDIDGTLLDSSFEVPEANRRAISAAVAAGIEVALVTGRRFDFALPVAKDLGCPLTMIVNNGALVKSHEGATHLRRLLPVETAREVLSLMGDFRQYAGVVFDRPEAAQVVREVIDWDNPQSRAYYLRNRQFLAEACPLESCLTEDPIQVMFTGTLETMRRAEERLRESPLAASYAISVTYYDDRDFGMVDVIRTGCSKGATLEEWAGRRGLGRHEIMAIGDNFNDREMLEFAGVPIVMGNSVPELKSQGWRETLTNDEAGVAAAIHEYALGTT